ncbi:hypothetical protein B0H14DRAFT_2576970 [Mycena olivaceomarginata]|nr:hypothetical protein B0H14DRAFT_2576970 [Mycena olivaceomarginata]
MWQLFFQFSPSLARYLQQQQRVNQPHCPRLLTAHTPPAGRLTKWIGAPSMARRSCFWEKVKSVETAVDDWQGVYEVKEHSFQARASSRNQIRVEKGRNIQDGVLFSLNNFQSSTPERWGSTSGGPASRCSDIIKSLPELRSNPTMTNDTQDREYYSLIGDSASKGPRMGNITPSASCSSAKLIRMMRMPAAECTAKPARTSSLGGDRALPEDKHIIWRAVSRRLSGWLLVNPQLVVRDGTGRESQMAKCRDPKEAQQQCALGQDESSQVGSRSDVDPSGMAKRGVQGMDPEMAEVSKNAQRLEVFRGDGRIMNRPELEGCHGVLGNCRQRQCSRQSACKTGACMMEGLRSREERWRESASTVIDSGSSPARANQHSTRAQYLGLDKNPPRTGQKSHHIEYRVPESRNGTSDGSPMAADLCQKEGCCVIARKNPPMPRKTERRGHRKAWMMVGQPVKGRMALALIAEVWWETSGKQRNKNGEINC